MSGRYDDLLTAFKCGATTFTVFCIILCLGGLSLFGVGVWHVTTSKLDVRTVNGTANITSNYSCEQHSDNPRIIDKNYYCVTEVTYEIKPNQYTMINIVGIHAYKPDIPHVYYIDVNFYASNPLQGSVDKLDDVDYKRRNGGIAAIVFGILIPPSIGCVYALCVCAVLTMFPG
jgi:hypothetical protein